LDIACPDNGDEANFELARHQDNDAACLQHLRRMCAGCGGLVRAFQHEAVHPIIAGTFIVFRAKNDDDTDAVMR
jgi:hypothetical protein